jgi:hypothetical protein
MLCKSVPTPKMCVVVSIASSWCLIHLYFVPCVCLSNRLCFLEEVRTLRCGARECRHSPHWLTEVANAQRTNLPQGNGHGQDTTDRFGHNGHYSTTAGLDVVELLKQIICTASLMMLYANITRLLQICTLL